MKTSSPLVVLVVEPHLAGMGWLREHVCEHLGGDLLMADSVAAMEAAIDAKIPDLVLIGPGATLQNEIDARRILRADRETAGIEVVRLGQPSAGHAADRSGFMRKLFSGGGQPEVRAEDVAVAKRRVSVAVERVRAARERRLEEELAARFRAAPTVSVKPSPTPVPRVEPVADGAAASRSRPNSTRFAPTRRPQVASMDGENEWGFFDAARCGADALAAALDSAPDDRQQGVVERSPADMLLDYDGVAAVARTVPVTVLAGAAVLTAPSTVPTPPAIEPWQANGAGPDSCEEAGPDPAVGDECLPVRHSRPFPLALWAHLLTCCHAAQQGPAALLRYTEAVAGVATLALGLNLSTQVGTVGYAYGCRIHRIRIAESRTPDTVPRAAWSSVASAGAP